MTHTHYDIRVGTLCLPFIGNGWVKTKKTSRIRAGRGTKVRTECLWINPAAKQKRERAA